MNEKDYLSIRCRLPASMEDMLPLLIGQWPVLGTHIIETAAGRISAAIFLDPNHGEAAGPLGELLGELGAEEVSVETVAAEDWLAGYRRSTRPFPIGHLWWIDPHPESPTEAPRGRHRLVIEPRMAFGSGSHESTKLVLAALETLDVVGADVLDVGTGSGILAVAAERLGAKIVVALDIDPDAVFVARQTAGQQVPPTMPRFFVGSVACLVGCAFDLVLCNMVASLFIPFLGELKLLLAAGGRAVLSGLLVSEMEAVVEALDHSGLSVCDSSTMGEWARLTVVPSAAGDGS
jgi:ribosomal protein L11 methyltransferase